VLSLHPTLPLPHLIAILPPLSSPTSSPCHTPSTSIYNLSGKRYVRHTLGLCVYSRWLSSAGHSEPRIPRVCGIPRCTLRRRRETDRVDGVGVIVASCSCGDEAGAHVCCREWHKGHVKCEGEVQIMNLNSSQVSRHRRDDQSLILISSIVTSHVRSQPR
jgi:hypothetical protein